VDRPQEKKQPHKKARLIFALIVLSILALLVWGFYSTYIRYSPKPLTTTEEKLPFGAAVAAIVDEDDFAFELLGEWREVEREESEKNENEDEDEEGALGLYIRWEPLKRAENDEDQVDRFFELYRGDKIPNDRPLNRFMPVVAEGSRLRIEGEPSYNCFAFAPQEATGDSVKVSWQNLSFLCDLKNTLKNVIGTGSELGSNEFEIEGEVSGKQRYFLVYGAGENSPTDSVLVHAVETFEAK
jgi:hypothetical protein